MGLNDFDLKINDALVKTYFNNDPKKPTARFVYLVDDVVDVFLKDESFFAGRIRGFYVDHMVLDISNKYRAETRHIEFESIKSISVTDHLYDKEDD